MFNEKTKMIFKKKSPRKYKSIKKQKGVALITVLLVVSLAVIISAKMANRLAINVKRASYFFEYNQGFWYALSAEELIKQVLIQDKKDSTTTHLGQIWAQSANSFPVEGGSISGSIKDMQSCFNLNSMAGKNINTPQNTTPKETQAFIKLLESLEIDVYQAEVIAMSIKDWIDKDDTNSQGLGAENNFYEARSYPHLAANNLIAHKSEMRSIQGVSRSIYLKISPFVCAVPKNSNLKININTISDEQANLLYAILSEYITLEDAQSIISERPRAGYDSVDEMFENEIFSNAKTVTDEDKELLTVTSDYFIADIKTNVANARFLLESVFVTKENSVYISRRQIGQHL